LRGALGRPTWTKAGRQKTNPAAFEAKGLAFSERKLERWLEEGLLPPADQIPLAYRGSEVRYLPGTAAQAIAIQELWARRENSISSAGSYGGAADASMSDNWRPRFIEAARFGDRALRLLKKLYRRDEKRNSPTAVSDRIVHAGSTDSLYLKIKRRIAEDEFPALVGAIIDTAVGVFHGAIPENWSRHS